MTYDNSNRGAIWKNKDKQKETQPDFKGSLNVAGVDYWVSAWKRSENAKDNSPALSFTVQPKDEVHKDGMAQAQESLNSQPAPADDFDQEIPF